MPIYHVVRKPWKLKYKTLKFLLAKRIYDGELLWQESVLIQEYFQDLYFSTNKDIVETTRFSLERLKLVATNNDFLTSNIRIELDGKILKNCIFHIHTMLELPNMYEYYGRKTYWDINKFILLGQRAKRRKAKNKRFLGVGYKDKGNRKNIAEDGSPSWQEVASATEYKTKWEEIEEDDKYFKYHHLIFSGWINGTHPKWE